MCGRRSISKKLSRLLLAVLAKDGEELVADLGAGPIVPLVPRPGVVHLDVVRDRQGRRQEFGLLLVEGLVPLGEDAVELAGGDVDAQLVQLFQEQRLGDVLVVVLVEDEADQVGSVVAAGQDLGGEWGHQACAVGGQPAFATVADDAGLEDQILNDEVLVSLFPRSAWECRPGRSASRRFRPRRAQMTPSIEDGIPTRRGCDFFGTRVDSV